MSQPALVVEAGDPLMTSDIVVEMLKQLRAMDTYDTYEGWSEEKIIDPLIMTKERKREILSSATLTKSRWPGSRRTTTPLLRWRKNAPV